MQKYNKNSNPIFLFLQGYYYTIVYPLEWFPHLDYPDCLYLHSEDLNIFNINISHSFL